MRPNLCKKTGKRQYSTWYDASRSMRSLAKNNREDVGGLEVYVCKMCGQYHVGHNGTVRRFSKDVIAEQQREAKQQVHQAAMEAGG